jgi:hypothetical protein
VVPKKKLSFILGNPPFVGYSNQNNDQKKDILSVCVDEYGKPYKTAGKIDYVAAWYYKASKYIAGTSIRVAFVSTNSITQGEQVAAVWKPLFEMFGIRIDFAYRTFKWSNEAKGKAAVHCVIIGFSVPSYSELARQQTSLFKDYEGFSVSEPQGDDDVKRRFVYEDDGTKIEAENINPYLVDAPNIFVESRTKPLCDIPELVYGNKPTDGGHLFIEADEYKEFIAKEPKAKTYIKKIYGSTEYINNIDRYCLWLVDAEPLEIKKMPLVMERIEKVRKFRLASKKEMTRDSAASPTLFQEIRQPTTKYVIIPRVSSEKRKYVPIGFLSPKIIVNDSVHIIPNATLYHFGILTSSVHNAWMRAVCGRLEMRYRYSALIVYNNFPWPDATDTQKAIIKELAQGVLDARSKFPKSSLAALYDPLTMPPALLKAHKALDKAVMKLYKFGKDMSEAEIVAELMGRYEKLVKGEK